MNRKKLAKILLSEGFPPYSFEFGNLWPLDDAFTIREGLHGWHVKYAERGQIRNCGTFDSENDACNFLYMEMVDAWPEELRKNVKNNKKT